VLTAFCQTKSLLCNVDDFIGMPYQFIVFKYSEYISPIWKGPYYDQISVTSIKKEFPDSKKTLQSLQLSKSQIPSLSSERPSKTPRHSSVSNINNDAFNQGFSQFSKVFFRDMFLEDSALIPKSKKLDPLQPSRRRDIPFGRPTVQSIIRLDNENFPSGPFSMWRSFELFQLASVWTFQQHVRMTLSVRPTMGFLSKTQILEDRYNRPNDVNSHSDALIHKASCAFKIQTSKQRPSWSGRTSNLYGNCMHLINHPDDHSLGSDAQSLDMEIACS